MQPYLFPYIGYFQLINAVDKFVIHDDVQWIKGGWINRNRILSNKGSEMITLAVKKRSNFDNINQYEIIKDQKNRIKFCNKIRNSYIKAPFFKDVFPILENILQNKETNINFLIKTSLVDIIKYLNIMTLLYFSSNLKKNNRLKGQERVLNICRVMKTSIYINPIGGLTLYDKNRFKQNNINLFFLNTKDIKYKQFGNDFIPNLSIIDVLMFNSKTEIISLLKQYILV